MEEIAEEIELKSVADIQNEIDKTVDSSKLLEHEFQADTEGEDYRTDIVNASLLQVRIVSIMTVRVDSGCVHELFAGCTS